MSLPAILEGLSLPMICSPLFIISNPDLVIAQCKAGVVGSFPALNARPDPALDEWLDRITTELGEYNDKHPDRPAAPSGTTETLGAPTASSGTIRRVRIATDRGPVEVAVLGRAPRSGASAAPPPSSGPTTPL